MIDNSSTTSSIPQSATEKRSLLDLMADGFYMLLLIQRGQLPTEQQAFAKSIRQFLASLERSAIREDINSEDVHAAKYAFCAMVDETILHSQCSFREEWSCDPLQLTIFGDHLAGENFFSRLEDLRAQGAPRLDSLEIYYFCLLLGFKGKYLIEGKEKLLYLIARLGDELIYLKGKRSAFAPHWQRPDSVSHKLRRVVPIWTTAAVLAVACLLGYGSLRYALQTDTQQQLMAYQNVVSMPNAVANITITLP